MRKLTSILAAGIVLVTPVAWAEEDVSSTDNYYFEMQNMFSAEFDPMILLFGFPDNQESCARLVAFGTTDAPQRSFRCQPTKAVPEVIAYAHEASFWLNLGFADSAPKRSALVFGYFDDRTPCDSLAGTGETESPVWPMLQGQCEEAVVDAYGVVHSMLTSGEEEAAKQMEQMAADFPTLPSRINAEMHRYQLWNECRPVAIDADVSSITGQPGPTSEEVKRKLRSLLHAVRLDGGDRDDNWTTNFLSYKVDILDGFFAYYSVKFIKPVRDTLSGVRNSAPTWEISYHLGYSGPQDAMAHMWHFTREFVGEYLEVNAEACVGPNAPDSADVAKGKLLQMELFPTPDEETP